MGLLDNLPKLKNDWFSGQAVLSLFLRFNCSLISLNFPPRLNPDKNSVFLSVADKIKIIFCIQ